MLLIIGIVGTTVAPWQLFFQQSYVVDKRITPRFIALREGRPGDRHRGRRGRRGRADGRSPPPPSPGPAARALHRRRRASRTASRPRGPGSPACCSRVALLDASIIGAFAVSLSTAYAIGDVLGLKHSLHRGVRQAKGFYAIYAGLIAVAAAHRADPRRPARPDHRGRPDAGRRAAAGRHGVPAAAVQRPRGARALGQRPRHQRVHRRRWSRVLITLSVVLTASVVFPGITGRQIIDIALGVLRRSRSPRRLDPDPVVRAAGRSRWTAATARTWRMPPLNMLSKPVMSAGRKVALTVLGSYMMVSMVMVIIRIDPDGARTLSPARVPGFHACVPPQLRPGLGRMVPYARRAGIGASRTRARRRARPAPVRTSSRPRATSGTVPGRGPGPHRRLQVADAGSSLSSMWRMNT